MDFPIEMEQKTLETSMKRRKLKIINSKESQKYNSEGESKLMNKQKKIYFLIYQQEEEFE